MSRTAQFTKTNIIVGAIATVIIVGGGVAAWVTRPDEQPKPATVNQQQITKDPAPPQAEVRTDYISYTGQDGKNALELLKAHTEVQTKSSSYGEFVAAINGQDGGGKKYWTFYINGEMAQVGAGAYQTKASDKIEWKLQ